MRPAQREAQRRRLDELGSSADYGEDLHEPIGSGGRDGPCGIRTHDLRIMRLKPACDHVDMSAWKFGRFFVFPHSHIVLIGT
jgi:hypothetical protein